MVTHHLKTWPEYFLEVRAGNKYFELRKNDRDFKQGDTVILEEYVPDTRPEEEKRGNSIAGYTGRKIELTISFILYSNPALGLPDGYCIFSFNAFRTVA